MSDDEKWSETFGFDEGEQGMRRDDFVTAVNFRRDEAEPHLPVAVNWGGRALAVRSVTATNGQLWIDAYDPDVPDA